jgi:hypothetical protein
MSGFVIQFKYDKNVDGCDAESVEICATAGNITNL